MRKVHTCAYKSCNSLCLLQLSSRATAQANSPAPVLQPQGTEAALQTTHVPYFRAPAESGSYLSETRMKPRFLMFTGSTSFSRTNSESLI